MINKINKTSDATKSKMKSKSMLVIPDNASEKGLKPNAIKHFMTDPIFDVDDSILAEMDRVVDEINGSVDQIEDKVEDIESSISSIKNQQDINTSDISNLKEQAKDFALQKDLDDLSDVVSDIQDDIDEISEQQEINTKDISDLKEQAKEFALQKDLSNLSDVVGDIQDEVIEIREQQTINTNDIKNLKTQASDFDSRITYNADSIGHIQTHYAKKEDLTQLMEYQHSVSSIEQILENPVHMGVYNVTEPFKSDSRFIDGGNIDYPKGTNVLLKINVENGVTTYTFDALGGVLNLDKLGGSKIFSSLKEIGYEEPANDFDLKDFADYCSNFEEGARVFLTHADFVSGSYPILYQKIFNNGIFTISNTSYVSVEIVNLSENNEGGAMVNVRYLNDNSKPTLQENYDNKWNQVYPAPDEHLNQSIAVDDWVEINDILPFKYQTTFQNDNIDADLTLVELINNNAILFVKYGFNIASVDEINKTITIYALEQPTESVELLFRLEK